MRTILTILSFVALSNLHAQPNLEAEAKKIETEGKTLFRSEMASWHGTDLFLSKYTNMENIGGYLSYEEKDEMRCIFFTHEDQPKVIGTIRFDAEFKNQPELDLSERALSKNEKDYYDIRLEALAAIQRDTFFAMYENTNLNIVPIIDGKEKRVYVLTGPLAGGVALFGNDYLLEFNEKNELVSQERLHNSLISVEYDGEMTSVAAVHSHVIPAHEFMTPTDVCTLMLYAPYTSWESHYVISENYVSIWDAKSNSLEIVTKESFDKMMEH